MKSIHLKLSRIALASASLLCGSSTFAITAASGAPQVSVYLSGATAMDQGVLEASIRMCQAGTLTAYTASNQFVYYCLADGARIAVPNGSRLAIHKHSVGGSGNGVQPINNAATTLPFMDLTLIAGGTGGCPLVPVAATSGGGQAYTLSACTGLPTATRSNNRIGISDVEPSFFGGPSEYANLAAEPLSSVVFGVPVTKVVYDALQVAQGLTGTCAASLVEACMPSLTTGEITSLYTQPGQTWNAVTKGAITIPGDDTVYVARRADTSGTQKSYEAVIARTINGNPAAKSCTVGIDGFVSGPEALNNNVVNDLCTGAEVVVNNSGSGQVAACLNRHQAGITSGNGVLPVVVATARGAVGTLSTETVTSAGGSIRFLKVNGLAPTLTNMNAGRYTFYTDSSLNIRGPLAGNDLAFYNAFKAQFAAVPVIQPFGLAGLDTLDSVTGVATGNPFTRSVNGEINNCQQARRIF